jgi:hypothetical protein
MSRRLTLFLASCLTASRLGAVVGAPYLQGPEGVRSSALAGAYGAVQGSAESQWYNPAGLSGLRGAELSLTHQSLDDALDSDHIVLGAFLGWQHSFGLMYDRQGATDTYRDDSANVTGSFQDSDSVLGLGYAYDLGWLSIGAEIKYLDESIEKLSGSSLAYDLGLQGKFAKEQVLYGLSLQNLGSAPNLGGPDVSLPTSLRASLGWHVGELAQALMLLADYHYLLSTGSGALALGAEYSEVYEDNSLAIRAGWDFGEGELGGLSGLSLGAGFSYKFLGVDYAWNPMDVLGNSHRIALTLTYDQKSQAQEKSTADYLGINPNAVVLAPPTPTPTPRPVKPLRDAHVGAELEALMAATPTPIPTPTPDIQALPKAPPQGIFGAIFSIFGFGKKEPVPEEGAKRPGGILRGFFKIFGLNNDEDKPTVLPDQPGVTPEASDEDKFVNPGASPAASPGPGVSPQVTPSLQPTPALQKVKGWLSF